MKRALHRRVQPLLFGVLTLSLAALGGCRKAEPQAGKVDSRGAETEDGQERMSGVITEVDEKARTVEVRDTLPSQNPNEFTRLYRTYRVPMDCKFESAAGGPAQFGDLTVDKRVKVRFTRDKQEFVANKISLRAEKTGEKER
jgi:hypothetical protein